MRRAIDVAQFVLAVALVALFVIALTGPVGDEREGFAIPWVIALLLVVLQVIRGRRYGPRD